MPPTLTAPNYLSQAGILMIAPLGTALPAMVATNGTYAADAWPAAWYSPGPTKSGSKIDVNQTVSQLEVAELYDPIDALLTRRVTQVTFELVNFTARNLANALNGAQQTTLSGTGVTLSTKVSPPVIGQEVPLMVGWESADSTVRMVAYQAKNSGNLSMQLAKAPNMTGFPWVAMLMKQASNNPFDFFFAGTARSL